MTRIEIQDADSVDPEVWLRVVSVFLRENIPGYRVTKKAIKQSPTNM